MRCLLLLSLSWLGGCGATEAPPQGPAPSAASSAAPSPAASPAPAPTETAPAPSASAPAEGRFHVVCHCCCGGVEPRKQCLYRAKGESLEKLIEAEKKPKPPCPPNAGCTMPVKYVLCD